MREFRTPEEYAITRCATCGYVLLPVLLILIIVRPGNHVAWRSVDGVTAVDPNAVDGRTVLRRLVGVGDGSGGAETEPILIVGGLKGTGGIALISRASRIERVVRSLG